MEQKFSEFRESEQSMKHELGSIYRSFPLPVSYLHCGSMLVYYTRGSRFKYSCLQKYSTNSVDLLKFTWRKLE